MSSDDTSSKTESAPASDVYVDAPAAPTPPARPGHSALILASVALVAAVTAPYWTPPVYRALHLRPPGLEWQARQDVETGRLGQSLAELDRRLADLNTAIAKANEQATGARTAQAVLETQVRVLALIELRAVLRRPVPFEAELKAVRAFGGKNDDLEPLLATIEPFASTGIPLETQLRREFASVADAVARTEARPGMVHWLTSFAPWPATPAAAPEAEPKPETKPSAVTDRAHAHLADSDLRGALDELAALEGDAASAARIWLAQAQARLAANAAADRIVEHIATALNRLPARP